MTSDPANPAPIPVAAKRDAVEWVKLAMGGGLGVMLAFSGWKYLTTEGKSNAEFMRTKVQENTTALVEVSNAIEKQVSATQVQTNTQIEATRLQTAAISNLAEKVASLTEASKTVRKSTDNLTSELKEHAPQEPQQ